MQCLYCFVNNKDTIIMLIVDINTNNEYNEFYISGIIKINNEMILRWKIALIIINTLKSRTNESV